MELLVAVAIIGVLIALLSPAVQQAREAASAASAFCPPQPPAIRWNSPAASSAPEIIRPSSQRLPTAYPIRIWWANASVRGASGKTGERPASLVRHIRSIIAIVIS
uniref:type II secretion system protein n=1 Tax=Blastopirellula marina TaxID=124 RepID=UPI000320B37E|nr:hypothetical protein [Blastopirellula marina]